MSEDLSNPEPGRGQRINVQVDWEIEYWSKTLGVTPVELRAAVRQAGVRVDDFRRELGK